VRIDRARRILLLSVRLEKQWCEIFRDLPLPSLLLERFPILLVIIPGPRREKNDSSLDGYQPQVLESDAMSIHISTWSTLEMLLETLRSFKQKFLFHQKLLVPFNITKSIALCPDVLVEIAEYLSLSDAINAFSMGILPLLRDGYSKVHLNNPSKRFVEMIRQHLDPRQVVSVHITHDPLQPTSVHSALCIFDQLSSLTVSSMRDLRMIYHYLHHLRNICRLSLWFKDQLNGSSFDDLTNLSNSRITHLHIHCGGTFVDPNRFEGHPDISVKNKNTTVTSFTLDLDYFPLRETTHVSSPNLLLFIRSALKFIGSLVNLRRLRLIITRDHLESILYVPRWQHWINECVHLERVIIHVVCNRIPTEKTKAFEEEMRKLRPGMIFRMQTIALNRMFSLPL
jgi:hypothetical protein